MDSLLESAKTYIDVLKCCSSDEVGSWKIEDLERAVNWAQYFKRVQGRIQKKPALVRKFDADLKEVGLQTGLRFGRQELSSQFLGDSLDYLITALLENPFLPSEIQELIHQKHANAAQLAHLEKVSSDRALLATLTTIHHKLTANLPPHAPSLQKSEPLLVADSLVLQEEVEWLLTLQPRDSESTHALPHSVCTKLEGLAKQEHGLEVILLSTISQPHAPSTSTLPEQNTNAFQTILQWLVQRLKSYHATLLTATSSAHSTTSLPKQTVHVDVQCLTDEDNIAVKLWELSPHLLASVSAKHLEFFRVYFELLTSRVNQLQAKVTREFQDRAMQQYCSEGLEIQVLPYFRALIAANPNVRDVTLALMTSQVEQAALQLLAVGTSCSKGTHHSGAVAQPKAIEYPANLWRKVLDKCCDESGHDKKLSDII